MARPGALQFVDKYAAHTNYQQSESIHPFFDEILKETGGVALYQEQLMKMANKIGFSLDEAEISKRKLKKLNLGSKRLNKNVNKIKFQKKLVKFFGRF